MSTVVAYLIAGLFLSALVWAVVWLLKVMAKSLVSMVEALHSLDTEGLPVRIRKKPRKVKERWCDQWRPSRWRGSGSAASSGRGPVSGLPRRQSHSSCSSSRTCKWPWKSCIPRHIMLIP